MTDERDMKHAYPVVTPRSAMKTITMTELREEPGERLIDIRRDNASFLITKNGKPAAKLVPPNWEMVNGETVIERDGTVNGTAPLTKHRDLGQGY